MNNYSKALLGTAIALTSSAQAATMIEVRMEAGQAGFAPLFAAFHSDTNYSTFVPGSAASAALENLAETGAPVDLVGSAPAGANAGPVFGNNPSGPPIFTPGGISSSVFTVDDTNNLFNYASMVLPSNDWFVGNATALDVSSLLNAAVGTSITIDVTNLWDAGTETEDFNFSAGNPVASLTAAGDGGPDSGADQGGVVSLLDTSATANPFSGFANADGFLLDGQSAADFSFAGNLTTITLTVVPEPSTTLLGALAAGALFLRRRR